MTYGLKIANADGTTQFDENYRNHVVVGKASSTMQAIPSGTIPGPGIQSYKQIGVGSGAQFPILFYTHDGSTFETMLGTPGAAFDVYSTAVIGTAINYWIFDYSDIFTGPLGHYGWKIVRADGALIYHSDLTPLRIVDFQSGDDYRTTQPSGSYPSGKKYAILNFTVGYIHRSQSVTEGPNHRITTTNQTFKISIAGGVLSSVLTDPYSADLGLFNGTTSWDYTDRKYDWSIAVCDVSSLYL